MLKDYITEEDLSSCAFSTLAKDINYGTYDEAKTLKIIKSTTMSLFATVIALDKFIDNGISIPNYIDSTSLFDFKVSMKSFAPSSTYQNQYNEILDKVVPFKDFASVITKSIEGLE